MSTVLGISAFYHDSAAALVRDGTVVAAAAQEERFSRVKHDSGFPGRAVGYCLDEASVTLDEVDYVGRSTPFNTPIMSLSCALMKSFIGPHPHAKTNARQAFLARRMKN